MWAPVLVFSSRMISYPCFPPLSRRDSTKRSRKLFTIRSLTALVMFSQGTIEVRYYRVSIQPPLLRGYRTLGNNQIQLSRETAFQGLECTQCRTIYSQGEALQKCLKCNGLLDTIINPEILGEISKHNLDRTPSMWKYKAFLPVDETYKIVSAGEGDTPLRKRNCVRGNVWVKDETRNPTGTFKDRGASLAITALSRLGVKDLVLSSEGNAGCSFALYSQIADLDCHVFLPRQANPAKVELSRKLGAKVTLVQGTIADAGRSAEALATEEGSYN